MRARLAEIDDDGFAGLGTTIGIGRKWIARPEQLPPDQAPDTKDLDEAVAWFVWFFRAGRGSGKTRSAAEWVLDEILEHGPLRVVVVGPTFADGRDTMIEGESGLLDLLPGWLVPKGKDFHWNRSIGELNLADGSYVKIHSSERSARLRGTQWHRAWVDEAAEFKDADLGIQKDTTWFNLTAGMRLGDHPCIAVTGTPKPVALIKEIIARIEIRDTWFETRGSTYDNLENLAQAFKDEVVDLYEGTELGRQELHGELVEGGGDVFDPTDLIPIVARPDGKRYRARCWDLAATEPHEGNRDPDWTVGTLLSVDLSTRDVAIEHMARFRRNTGKRDALIKATAIRDRNLYGPGVVEYHIEYEGGSGGKAQVDQLQRDLDGIVVVHGKRVTGSKVERARLPSGALQQGRMSVVVPAEIGDEVEWDLSALTTEMREFREDEKHAHDDIVDTLSLFYIVMPERKRVEPAAGPIAVSKAPNRPV